MAATARHASSAMPASKGLKAYIDELYHQSVVTSALLPLSEEQYAGFVEVFIPKSQHDSLSMLVQNSGYLERLAWGGDRVLGHIVSDYLLERLPEGEDADRDRAYQHRVNNYVLHNVVAPRLRLKQFVPLENSQRDNRRKLGADLFEALVYKINKTHGFEVVKAWVLEAVMPLIEEGISSVMQPADDDQDPEIDLPPDSQPDSIRRTLGTGGKSGPPELKPYLAALENGATETWMTSRRPPQSPLKPNYKGLVLELTQKQNYGRPIPEFVKSGEEHRPYYVCVLALRGHTVRSTPRTQKKEAEQEAYRSLFEQLRGSCLRG